MTKKFLPLLLICSLLTSCGIEYDGTTKIIFEGTVTNENGTPLPNIPVAIKVTDGDYSDMSGRATTDAEGHYHVVTPGAEEEVRYLLQINYTGYDQVPANAYTTTTYYNIIPQLINDYLINFNDTAIYTGNTPVTFSVSLNNASGSNLDVIKVNVLGLVKDEGIDYNFATPPLGSTSINFYGYDYFPGSYAVAQNQQLIVKYMLSDGSVHQETVNVGAEDITYTITY